MGTARRPPASPARSRRRRSPFSADPGRRERGGQDAQRANARRRDASFTDTDDAVLADRDPGERQRARHLSAAVNVAGLAQGTYTATVTVASAGTSGSPEAHPRDAHRRASGARTRLTTGPASLTFSGVAGGANPAAQNVSVTNTGGGTLSYTATDNQTWITESPPRVRRREASASR